MTIKDIRSMLKNGIIITEHGKKRMRQRFIKITTIESAIENGEIIKIDTDTKPFPSCLVSHNDLRVAVANDGVNLHLLTVYRRKKR